MDKTKLKEILSTPYTLESWQEVLIDVFGVRNLKSTPTVLTGFESDKIKSVFELGSFETYDERLIGLFQVNVSPDIWLDKNKVQLRNSLKSIYKYDVDGAIIVFVQEDKWRLSFVAEVKVLNEKNEITNLETHPKRFTYLLGKSQLVRTPLMRLATLMGKQFTLAELRDAFSVEALNKEFYLDYSAISRKIIKYIWPQSIENKLNAHQGALNLLNRLMFVYFIQKKGWMMNDPEFIINFWKEYKTLHWGQNEFHPFWLNKVFFKAFNGKAYSDPEIFRHLPKTYHQSILSFPYLNGGLFTNHPDFDQFLLPDDLLDEIFEFLQRYNFTIKEDSDEEVNLEINPELLGKMYEGMINATDLDDVDAENGIVYTERPEINFMTRRSFVEVFWKKKNLKGFENLNGLSREFIYHFCFDKPAEKLELLRKYKIHAQQMRQLVLSITACDPACGSGSMLIGVIQLQMELLSVLDEFAGKPHTHHDDFMLKKQIISESIYGVDIKEWAVRIAELRFWLFMIADAEFTTDELTKEPLLPNLDFKLRQGNSLLQQIGTLDFSFEGLFKKKDGTKRSRNTGATRLLNEFIKKKKVFITNQVASDTTYEKLKAEEIFVFKSFIKELIFENQHQIHQLSKGDGQASLFGFEKKDHLFEGLIADLETENEQLYKVLNSIKGTGHLPFSFDIDFMEIFLTNHDAGFDLVIGNPPYVRQEDILPADDARELERLLRSENKTEKATINKAYKEQLSAKVYQTYPFLATKARTKIDAKTKTIDVYGSKVPGRSDLYVYFQLLGPALLNSNGTFCFIISNSWLDVEFGGFVQQFLLKHTQLYAIYDCNVRSFSASVNTVIYLHSAITNNQLTDSQYKTFQPSGEPIRFVMNKADYSDTAYAPLLVEQEHCSGNTFRKHYRIISKTPQELWNEGYDTETLQYQSNKWGGKYLHAPEIFYRIIQAGEEKDLISQLKTIVRGERYLNTGGADGFFIIDEFKQEDDSFLIKNNSITEDGKKKAIMPFSGKISSKYLIPLLKDEFKKGKTIIANKADALCLVTNESNDALADYISWGEANEYHQRSVTKIQNPWFKPTNQMLTGASILVPRSFNEVFSIHYNPQKFLSLRFYRLHVNEIKYELQLIGFLNSTLVIFFQETLGNKSLGQGALDFFMSDFLRIKIPIVLKSEFEGILNKTLLNREIYSIFTELGFDRSLPIRQQHPKPLPDRKELDDLIFDELGLTIAERNGVYWATAELVKQRLDKAASR